ncbi:MAG: hypothetical protein HYX55_10715 [Chloroflexi bacterium]|nr:hypothetical protein [Chloroflexota bacterium]
MIAVPRRSLVVIAMLASITIVLAVVLPPDARVALARIAIVGAGIGISTLYLRRSGAATGSTPERFELELRSPAETQPAIPGLRAVEAAVRLSTANATDFDVRLRPMLRELARWRLLTNRGLDMDGNPVAARRILGPSLASLLEGTAEPPPFGSPGIPLAAIDAALDQLEQI